MTKLSKPSSLADWAAKRANNLDRMLAEAGKDDAALFSYSMAMLDSLAHLLTNLGDDAGALYVASLARLLENKHRVARRRGKRRSR